MTCPIHQRRPREVAPVLSIFKMGLHNAVYGDSSRLRDSSRYTCSRLALTA